MTNYSPAALDLTIVVNTCDVYQDVLDIFFLAFRACWPECPYPVVVNAESNKYNYNATVHNYSSKAGADDWGDRMRSTLTSVDTNFVLLVYDDFILDAQVSCERLDLALQFLRLQENAVVAYLINTQSSLEPNHNGNMFIPIKDHSEYRLNSAPAIWRKDALMKYTFAGDTPWAWEVFGTYRTWGDGNIFYTLNPSHSDIYPYNYKKGGAIYRGKWVREVVQAVTSNYTLDIDWNLRGFASDTAFEKRSLIWKFRFFQRGFQMVGLKALFYLKSYVKEKLRGF